MLDWAEGGGGGAWAAWLTTGLVTYSILFWWLFAIKDQCKKVRFQQTHNQGCASVCTRELLGGTEEKSVSPTRGHRFALQATRWFFLQKGNRNKKLSWWRQTWVTEGRVAALDCMAWAAARVASWEETEEEEAGTVMGGGGGCRLRRAASDTVEGMIRSACNLKKKKIWNEISQTIFFIEAKEEETRPELLFPAKLYPLLEYY